MPPKVQHTQAQYVLHPSVLDSALQGCIAMAREESAVQGGARLLYAIDEVQLIAQRPIQWAWIRISPESSARIEKLDVELCDEHGEISARLLGVSTRTVSLSAPQGESSVLLAPLWDVASVPEAPLTPAADSCVWVIGADEAQQATVKRSNLACLME